MMIQEGDCQLIVPMSGFGERFRRAGYITPKPIIQFEGKPLISYVVNQFPNAFKKLLICNERHLASQDFNMRAAINSSVNNPSIKSIISHKLGPVHSILQAADHIDDDRPAIVAYCDCLSFFDKELFFKTINNSDVEGLFLTYTGFHPHLLRSMFHAYILEDGKRIINIQEKKPFTENPISERASSGVYYFSSGKFLKEACKDAVKNSSMMVNGEYFVSLVFKPFLASKNITFLDIDYFINWGTPEDFSDFLLINEIIIGNNIKTSININLENLYGGINDLSLSPVLDYWRKFFDLNRIKIL